MPSSPPSPAAKQSPSPQLAPDLVLRVGFAGKRELTAAQSKTFRHRLRDVFSTIGRCLVELVLRIPYSNQKSTISNLQSSISAAAWVTQITADPERAEDAIRNASASHGEVQAAARLS